MAKAIGCLPLLSTATARCSVQTLSQGSEQTKPVLTELLLELFQPKAIIERNDSKVRALEGLPQTISILHGSDPGEIVCRENGLPFTISCWWSENRRVS
jgi:23S rRNA (cytosine1962-C5)-methyltransferase